MNKDLRTSSRGPSLIVAVTAFLLLTVGVSFCRSVKTESKWFGLASQVVDQGPDWFSILLLVAVGKVAAYAISKALLSKPTVAGASQTTPSASLLSGVTNGSSPAAENIHHGLNLNKPGSCLLFVGLAVWRLGYYRSSPFHGSTFWLSVACLSMILGIVFNYLAWRRNLIARRSAICGGRWCTSLMVMGMGVLALMSVILVILVAADRYTRTTP